MNQLVTTFAPCGAGRKNHCPATDRWRLPIHRWWQLGVLLLAAATSAVAGPTATKLVFTSSAFSLVAGQVSSTITVQRQNSSSVGVTAETDRTITLSSSSSSGTFSPGNTLTIPNGASSVNFTYTDTKAGSPTLTAASTLPTAVTSATQLEAITKATPTFSGLQSFTTNYGSSLTVTGQVFAAGGVYPANGETVTIKTNGFNYATTTTTGGVGAFSATLPNLPASASTYTITYSLAADTSLNATADASTTVTVNPLPVTFVSGLTAINKNYDGTTTATLSSNTVVLAGVLAGDAANVYLRTNGYIANFASQYIGLGQNVTVTGLTLAGTKAGNYTFSQPTGLTANIAATNVSVLSGLTVDTKAYDGTTTATISSNAITLLGVATADSATIGITTNGYSATFNTPYKGTTKPVTTSGLALTTTISGLLTNYSLVQPLLTGTILPLGVTITGVTTTNKIYNTSNRATLSGGVVSGTVAGDIVIFTPGIGIFSSYTVGTWPVTANSYTLTNSGISTNYTLLAQPLVSNASILPQQVYITSGLTINNKTYDTTTAATIISNNIVLDSIYTADIGTIYLPTNGCTAAFNNPYKGSGKMVTITGLNFAGSSASNYVLMTPPQTFSANITAAPVTLTGVTAASKVYNATTVASLSGGTITGLGSDTVTFIAGTGSFSSKYVGTWPVTASGYSLSTSDISTNYFLSAQPIVPNATISNAPLNITYGITVNSKSYDGSTVATISSNSVLLSGVLPADAGSVFIATNNYVATFASQYVHTGLPVTISGLTLNAGVATNYSLTQPSNLSANITSATVTVTSGLTANNKVFDTTAVTTINSNNITLSGVAAADTGNVSVSTNGYSALFVTPGVGNQKPVLISGLTLTTSTTGLLTNYNLTQPTLSANITPYDWLVLTSTENPAGHGDSVGFSATLTTSNGTAGNATGSVVFKLNGVPWSTNLLATGVASSSTTANLMRWMNQITAEYRGDVNYYGTTNLISELVTNASQDGFLAEDFNYSNLTYIVGYNTTNMIWTNGLANRGSTGWGGAWWSDNINVESSVYVGGSSNSTLSYTGGGYNIIQATPNGAAEFPQLSWYSGAYRPVAVPLTNVVWFSTLLNVTADTNAYLFDPNYTNADGSLYNNGMHLVSYNTNLSCIGFNTTKTNVISFAGGTSDASYIPSTAYSVGLSNDTLFVAYGGFGTNSIAYEWGWWTNYTTVATNLTRGQAHLIVGCITFQASGANDQLQVWADPSDLYHLGTPLFSESTHDFGSNIYNVTIGGVGPREIGTGGRQGGRQGVYLGPTVAQVSAIRFSDGNGDVASAFSDVTGLTTTLSLTSSSSTNDCRNPITFLAKVLTNGIIARDASGTIQFQTNAVNYGGLVAVTNGISSLTITNLLPGNNLITAIYFGTTNLIAQSYPGSQNSITQVTTSTPPSTVRLTLTRLFGQSVKLALSDLATNWSDVNGVPMTLTSISQNSTNGRPLFAINFTPNSDGSYVITNTSFIGYLNPSNVNDQFSYGVRDSYGGTNIGYVNVLVSRVSGSTSPMFGQAAGILPAPSKPVLLNFLGHPGYSYNVQRSTNLVTWSTIWTTNAPPAGPFSYPDSFADLGGHAPSSAYYRLSWNP